MRLGPKNRLSFFQNLGPIVPKNRRQESPLDIVLTFCNGLDFKLLPAAYATYDTHPFKRPGGEWLVLGGWFDWDTPRRTMRERTPGNLLIYLGGGFKYFIFSWVETTLTSIDSWPKNGRPKMDFSNTKWLMTIRKNLYCFLLASWFWDWDRSFGQQKFPVPQGSDCTVPCRAGGLCGGDFPFKGLIIISL